MLQKARSPFLHQRCAGVQVVPLMSCSPGFDWLGIDRPNLLAKRFSEDYLPIQSNPMKTSTVRTHTQTNHPPVSLRAGLLSHRVERGCLILSASSAGWMEGLCPTRKGGVPDALAVHMHDGHLGGLVLTAGPASAASSVCLNSRKPRSPSLSLSLSLTLPRRLGNKRYLQSHCTNFDETQASGFGEKFPLRLGRAAFCYW